MKSLKFKTLIKKQGKSIAVWRLKVSDKLTHAEIEVEWGTNKTQTKITIINGGKNIGKTNETTYWQQACNEAAAMWKEQIDRKGYIDPIDQGYEEVVKDVWTYNENNTQYPTQHLLCLFDEDENKTFLKGIPLPMKCALFYNDKGKPRLQPPYFVQPKYDGVRCMLLWDDNKNEAILYSKTHTNYVLPHITKNLTKSMFIEDNGNKIIYDGEIYCHGMSLQDIVSCARVNQLQTISLQFYCFDTVNEYQQEKRLLFRERLKDAENIKIVPTSLINSATTLLEINRKIVKAGYEGLIVRSVSNQYTSKRSTQVLKLKNEIREEFIILGVESSPKNPDIPIFILQNNVNALTFNCMAIGDTTQRLEYLNNSFTYIGKKCTVKFFNRTPDKQLPHHATIVIIH